MKTFLWFVVVFFILISGCRKDNGELKYPGDGFSMVVGGRVVLSSDDINYYVLSTHFIYLKGTNPFLNGLVSDSFQVYAGREKIYSGVFQSAASSSFPLGPAIYYPDIFYEDYVLPITLGPVAFVPDSSIVPDPRGDPRIIKALQSQDQLHAGLKCEIKSVNFGSAKNVSLELELTNNDSFNYYYLDPEKMGLGLFHYFTNGLSLWSPSQKEFYENHVQHLRPEPYDKWQMNWLSLIRSHEKKTIRIDYTNFDSVPAGEYRLTFRFPGLGHVSRADLVQPDGRIWLGDLALSQMIQVD